MATRSFTSKQAPEGGTFDINGEVFHLRPSVPGDVLLDFLVSAESESAAVLANTVRALIAAALVPEDFDRWTACVRDPANNVDLNMLSEIAGFMAESLSGNVQEKQPQPSTAG